MGNGQSSHQTYHAHAHAYPFHSDEVAQSVAPPATHWPGAGLETVSTCLTVLPDTPSLEPMDVTHFYYEPLSHYSAMGWELGTVSGESGIQIIPVFEKPSSQPIEVRMWFHRTTERKEQNQRKAPGTEAQAEENKAPTPKKTGKRPMQESQEEAEAQQEHQVVASSSGASSSTNRGAKSFPYKVVRCAFRSHADAGFFTSSQVTQMDLILPTLSDHAKMGWRLCSIFCVGAVCQHSHHLFTEFDSHGFVDLFLHRPSEEEKRRFVYACSPLTYTTHMNLGGVGKTNLHSTDITSALARSGQSGWHTVAVIPMSLNTHHGLFKADVTQYLLAVLEQPADREAVVQETVSVLAPGIEYALPSGFRNLSVALKGRDDYDRALHKHGDLRAIIARWGEKGWRFVSAIPVEGSENFSTITLKTRLIFQRDQMKTAFLNEPEFVSAVSPTLIVPLGATLVAPDNLYKTELEIQASFDHRLKMEENKARKERLIRKKELELLKLEQEARDADRRIAKVEREAELRIQQQRVKQAKFVEDLQNTDGVDADVIARRHQAMLEANGQRPRVVRAAVVHPTGHTTAAEAVTSPISTTSGFSSSESTSDIEADELNRRRERIRHQAKAARKWRKSQGLEKIHPDSKHQVTVDSIIVDERRLHAPLIAE